jgi:hypothetical protein
LSVATENKEFTVSKCGLTLGLITGGVNQLNGLSTNQSNSAFATTTCSVSLASFLTDPQNRYLRFSGHDLITERSAIEVVRRHNLILCLIKQYN